MNGLEPNKLNNYTDTVITTPTRGWEWLPLASSGGDITAGPDRDNQCGDSSVASDYKTD
jgi:hypothetical protein